jgi:surfeit locus 1 family protein
LKAINAINTKTFKTAAGTYVLRPPWLPTLVCLVLFCVLVSLGRWQWQRADYKESLQQQFLAGESSRPLSVSEIMELGRDVHGYPVTVSGEWDKRVVLLDNQVHQKMAGYHVISPLIQEDGSVVLVNRGWVTAGKFREKLPEIPVPVRVTSLSGKAYFPSEKPFQLKEDQLTSEVWPLRVQVLDLQGIASALGVELAPFVIRAHESERLEAGEQYPREWHYLVMGPEKSRAYSYQWFAMALVLMVLYGFLSLHKISHDTDREHTPD